MTTVFIRSYMIENIAQAMFECKIKSISLDKSGRPVNIVYVEDSTLESYENTETSISHNPFVEKPALDDNFRDDPDLWDDGERPTFKLEEVKKV